jgi:ferredoxin
MTKLRVTVNMDKCQGYGACVKIAPDVFGFNAEKKAEVGDPGASPNEVVLKAARCCPYRAITVADIETGMQLHPRVKAQP